MRKKITSACLFFFLTLGQLSAWTQLGVLAGGSWSLAPSISGALDGAGRGMIFLEYREAHWPASLGLAAGYSAYSLSDATGFSYRLASILIRSWWEAPLGWPDWLALEVGVMAGAGFERLGTDSRGGYGRAFLLGTGLRTRFDLGGISTGLEANWEWAIEPENDAWFFTAGIFIAFEL
jgi:hypothetical protein